MKKYFLSTTSGFTLVETLVAILALSLSLGALTLIATRTVIASRDAEQRVQAEMLALEGLEIVQQKVMSLVINGSVTPFDVIAGCGNGCSVSYTNLQDGSISLTPCTVSTTCPVRNNAASTGLPVAFGLTGATTPFRRLIYATPSTLGNGGYEVRSVVWYSPSSATTQKTIVLTKEMRPWYEDQVVPPPTP